MDFKHYKEDVKGIEFKRILNDLSPKEEYVGGRKILKFTTHWGQRKLILSEIEFLLQAQTKHPGNRTVVYIGAAPGNHIPYLSSLFPDLIFHCYDPAKFQISETSKIKLYNTLYTEETARTWKNKAVLFISDIRTVKPGKDEPDNDDVEKDMKLQLNLVKLTEPSYSSLKFRLRWWNTGEPDLDTEYFQGDIYLPVWGRKSTTECRLFVDDYTKLRKYNNKIYQDQMYYFNNKSRVCKYDCPECDMIEGMDGCYDCTSEITIIKNYLGSRRKLGKLKEMVSELSDIIANEEIAYNLLDYERLDLRDNLKQFLILNKLTPENIHDVFRMKEEQLGPITIWGLPVKDIFGRKIQKRGNTLTIEFKDYESEIICNELHYYNLTEYIKSGFNRSTPKVYREQVAILERWLISMANNKDPNTEAIYTRVAPDTYFHLKAIEEFETKGITPAKSKELIDYINNYPLYPTEIMRKQMTYDLDTNTLRIDKLSMKGDRIKILFNYDPFLATRIMIRYLTMSPQGQQWGLTQKTMDYLYDNGVRIEGFASALNSKMFGRKNSFFCSLFPEIEAPFGSIGSFFDNDLTKYEGDICVNPPFVEDILIKVSEKIDDTLSKSTKTIYVYYPEWPDAEGIKMIEKSKYLISKKIYSKNGYIIEIDGIDTSNVPFSSAFYVLSSKPKADVEPLASGYYYSISLPIIS